MRNNFDFFDKVIQDFSTPFANQSPSLAEYRDVIASKTKNYYNVIVATIQKKSGGYEICSREKICCLHPAIERVNKSQLSLFQNNIEETLDLKVLKALKLKKGDVLNYRCEQSANRSKIFVTVKSSLDRLNEAEARYYYYNILLKEEIAKRKDIFIDDVRNLKSKEEAEHYVHLQQQTLLNLSFKLTKFFDAEAVTKIYKPAVNYSVTEILYLTYIYLEDLLRFFETTFFNYINHNIQIPYRSTLVKIYGIAEKLPVVKDFLVNSKIDVELLNIIYKPFLKLSVITFSDRITYKELAYSNTFLSAFYELAQHNPKNIETSEIIDVLYQYNYNSLTLFNFKTAAIKKQLTHYTESKSKIDYLNHCLKTVKQRQCKLHIAYNSDLPSLKQQLVHWLEEELNYLNKSIVLNTHHTDEFKNTVASKTKITSGLSVSQLSLFYKLCMEVGIITHENQSDVIRLITDNFRTQKTSNISADSVRNKFYNSDEASKEALKDYVIKILNNIKD